MNIPLNNVTQHIQAIRQRAEKAWNTFLFMPTHYWSVALVICMICLLVILCLDAFLFWRYVLTREQNYNNTNNAYSAIERKSLEVHLLLLTRRKEYFEKEKEIQPMRNIFRVQRPPSAE